MMDRNDAIEISRVANGFVVKRRRESMQMIDIYDVHVFETMGTLADFIEGHFDWPEKKKESHAESKS